ncbi:MAG: hypothetical protein CXR30_05405 [Geobacter sp.]|nr:MAG: hypothetical protein CXR30_05405 [Geobacter sp.]
MVLHIPEVKTVAFTSDKVDVCIPEKTRVNFDVRSYSTKPDEGEHFNPTVSLKLTFYLSRIVFSDSEKTAYRIKMPIYYSRWTDLHYSRDRIYQG